jgi:4-hydroxybenzoate polyprenyltransferase
MRPAGHGPPSLRSAALASVLVLCGELVVWQLGGRLGALSLAAAVVGIALTVSRRSRRWGATLLVAAAVGLLVAVMFVVAATPRTGG